MVAGVPAVHCVAMAFVDAPPGVPQNVQAAPAAAPTELTQVLQLMQL